MLKTVIGLLTALFVVGFPLAYAQDASSPVPSQADFKALTDARIGIVKAAVQLTPEQEKLWPPIEEANRRDINDTSRWLHRWESRGGADVRRSVTSDEKLYPD